MGGLSASRVILSIFGPSTSGARSPPFSKEIVFGHCGTFEGYRECGEGELTTFGNRYPTWGNKDAEK